MAASGEVVSVHQTTDGETFINEVDAENHQRELNLRQEFAELAANAGFGSSLSAVINFCVEREADILSVYAGGDFEPPVVE